MNESLEEDRDYLLRSLEDLEQEREAGDIDEADYLALKEDYTARAADVLRALDPGAGAGESPDGLGRTGGAGGVTAAVARRRRSPRPVIAAAGGTIGTKCPYRTRGAASGERPTTAAVPRYRGVSPIGPRPR